MKVTSSIVFAMIASLTILMFPSEIVAETQTPENTTTVTPINEEISLQKTITTMTVPEGNTLPWGSVRGSASEYVERYPVIIQFFDESEEMVHVAQVDVKGDGSYEYKFRVLNVDESGETEKIFDGQYTVMIFKVVPNQDQTI
ncbi:hypothetical protein NsoK4_02075 [Nitrosopumilus sp. K4]|uniref:hypothetical protein n=1 Tax=Nitrosopumilus sp. K4 TaxID=2795383 RepID=UPI001BAC64BD|nr:hypothetical protein [Nitrosopumilus sp. K4]QUC65079.1 hypothetical protein NsoK4_02075 [Nitrosopumilus sp. K4]